MNESSLKPSSTLQTQKQSTLARKPLILSKFFSSLLGVAVDILTGGAFGVSSTSMIQRSAVRALLLAEPDSLLLTRIYIPERGTYIWIAPGGGIEPTEEPAQCLIREVQEETGHAPTNWVGPVWTRRHVFEFRGETYDQREAFCLVRTPRFNADHSGNPAEIEQALFREFRWWPLSEMKGSKEIFLPRTMARHLEHLLQHGHPGAPVEVGV